MDKTYEERKRIFEGKWFSDYEIPIGDNGPEFLTPPEPENVAIPGLPEIERVIYNGPATVVLWADDSKTVVKCSAVDTYSPEVGLQTAILTRMLGRSGLRKLYKEYGRKEEK